MKIAVLRKDVDYISKSVDNLTVSDQNTIKKEEFEKKISFLTSDYR